MIAASIDGGNIRTFVKIALPLAKPIIAVMVILQWLLIGMTGLQHLFTCRKKADIHYAACSSSDFDSKSGDGKHDGKYGWWLCGSK